MVIGDRIRALDETAWVLGFVKKSDDFKSKYVPVWDEVLSNYMVNPFSSGMTMTESRGGVMLPDYRAMAGVGRRTASVLKDPETHQIVESIASQGLQLLLGQRDNITATPLGADDYEKSRLIARLLMSIMTQPGSWRTHYQLIKDAFLFGTAILEIGWETRSRFQFVPDGTDARGLVPREVVYRDRPLQRIVDIYDFYPDPSGTRIQEDMIGVAKRFRITAAEALRLARAGVYDIDDVRLAIGRQLGAAQGKSQVAASSTKRRFEGDVSDLPDQMMMLDGLEYWGESPVTSPDKIQNRVITLLNGVRVRSRGNPYLDGCIPFKEIVVNPIAGRFYGLSPAEVVRFLQDSTDALLMSFTDLVTRAAKAPILVGNAFGANPQELKEQGGFIFCADVDKVKTMPVEVNVLQFIAAEIVRRKMTMREGSGATNAGTQPISSGGDKTATEVSEIARLASQRVEPMIQLIERDDYPWIGRTLHSRLRQFLPDGGAVAALAGEIFEVPLESVDVDADIRFTGTRLAGSRYQHLVQYREMGNVLGSPVGRQLLLTMPEILVRWFRDGADIPDAEQIIENAQKRTLALMQLETMQAAAGASDKGQPSIAAPGAPETFGTQAGETEREGQRIS